ncbi:hypothetical protein GCM10009731_39150 [Streptomyces globosus]
MRPGARRPAGPVDRATGRDYAAHIFEVNTSWRFWDQFTIFPRPTLTLRALLGVNCFTDGRNQSPCGRFLPTDTTLTP